MIDRQEHRGPDLDRFSIRSGNITCQFRQRINVDDQIVGVIAFEEHRRWQNANA